MNSALQLLTCLTVLAVTPPQHRAQAGEETLLFDGKTLDGWEKLIFGGDGAITVSDGSLKIGEGAMLSGIRHQSPEKLPTSDYEVEIVARRVSGFDFFCALTFPVGNLETCATFVVGGWGGAVVGISSIDGLDASENNSASYMHFEEGRWYTIRLRVTHDRLTGWIDDKEVFGEEITGKTLTLRPGQIDMCAPFGIATFQTTSEIRSVLLRPINTDE